MRETGLKAVTVWLPKEGAVRVVRYPEKERGEVITRALALLESQGEFGTSRDSPQGQLTGNDATLTGKLTGEAAGITDYPPRELTGNEPPGPQATLTGESTRELTGEAANEAATLTGESTGKLPGKARALRAQGVSWREIAQRLNAEGIPTLSGKSQWHGANVARLVNSNYSAS
jgi:hypothetical protein